MLSRKALSVKTGIKQKVITEIKGLAMRHGITKVVLFGSRARGDFHDRSDIDLAVSGGDAGRFRLAVEEETNTLLKFDVVELEKSVSCELLAEIEKDGLVLYEKV